MTTQKAPLLEELFTLVNSDPQKEYIQYLQSLNSSIVQYNAIIISLYGCFQNYLESILSEYIDSLFKKYNRYEDFPKKIQGLYTTHVGEFLMSPGKYSNYDFDTETVLTHYLNFINSKFSDGVDKEFLLMRSGNYKSNKIIEMLTRFDIIGDESEIYKCDLLRNYHTSVEGLDYSSFDTKARRKSSELYSRLDELVDARNSVAHSWSVDSRIGIHDIITYTIPFLKCVADIVLRAYLIKLKEEKPYTFPNTEPIDVYNNHILCMNTQGYSMHVNDYLILKDATTSIMYCAKIIEMQIDHNSVSETSEGEAIDVGLNLDVRVSPSDSICYYIHKE